jgi:hypothetical protein
MVGRKRGSEVGVVDRREGWVRVGRQGRIVGTQRSVRKAGRQGGRVVR